MKPLRHLIRHAAAYAPTATFLAAALAIAAALPNTANAADHRNFGRLNDDGSVSYAPAYFIVDGRLVSEFSLSDSDYLKRGYARIVDAKPKPSAEDRIVVATGWVKKDGKIYRVYEERAIGGGGGAFEELIAAATNAITAEINHPHVKVVCTNEHYFLDTEANAYYDVTAGTNGLTVVFPSYVEYYRDKTKFNSAREFTVRIAPADTTNGTYVTFKHLITETLEFPQGSRDRAFCTITEPTYFDFALTATNRWRVCASAADSALTKEPLDTMIYAPTGTATVCSTMVGNPYGMPVKLNELTLLNEDGTTATPDNDDVIWYYTSTGKKQYIFYKASKKKWRYAKSELNPVTGFYRTVYVYDITIEPGRAFWYDRRGKTNLKIKWTKPVDATTTNTVTNTTNTVTNTTNTVSSVRANERTAAEILPGKNLATSAAVSPQDSWPIRRQDSMARLSPRLRRRKTV